MIETLRKLEKAGLNHDIILTYPVNAVLQRKGSLSSFNIAVKSIVETQPKRKTATDSVWGMDGEYDFSTPETYSRRSFAIVFMIFEECGNRYDQRNAFVKWLKGADCRGQSTAFKNATKLELSRRKNTYYTNLWIDIGSFREANGSKGRFYSELTVTITTAPRFYKDGEQII